MIRIREVAKSVALTSQRRLKLLPRGFCLISGAPRSGTTALFNWLGHQPGVSAFLESRILVSVHAFMKETQRFADLNRRSATTTPLARRLVFDFYSSSRVLIGRRLIVDKEPLEPIAFPARDYGLFIGNIKTLLPSSKLLLAVRDPLSTIWSMSQRKWGESLTDTQAKSFSLEDHTDNWCCCADLVLEYCSDPNTYIVQFGRLMMDPASESRRICDFLGIRAGKAFEPRQTKGVGFSKETQERIQYAVQPRLELLTAKGISHL